MPGAGVVVAKRNNAVLIKEFVRRDDTTLVLRQYQPADLIECDAAEIQAVHTVVGLDEP
jgi:phage repressor protein C with HTH and peptisase S24 domain